jgi:hypothetical protein
VADAPWGENRGSNFILMLAIGFSDACEVYFSTVGQIKRSLHEYTKDFGPTFEGLLLLARLNETYLSVMEVF